jgi:hypothetical protein
VRDTERQERASIDPRPVETGEDLIEWVDAAEGTGQAQKPS